MFKPVLFAFHEIPLEVYDCVISPSLVLKYAQYLDDSSLLKFYAVSIDIYPRFGALTTSVFSVQDLNTEVW